MNLACSITGDIGRVQAGFRAYESEKEDSREKERRFFCSLFPSSRGSGASSETQRQIVGARESSHYLPLGLRACFISCVPKSS